MVTMAPSPLLSEIMPKHDGDGGDIGEKNIGRRLGLVRIDLMQGPIKKHIYKEQKNHSFCQSAHRLVKK
jgi:hypothetical protein